jgi:hypothetical protein
MRSQARKAFYSQANAEALGGFIEKPFRKAIPSQASASLPPVGGYHTTRTEHFNFEEIVSCRSAYTRVSGSEGEGHWSLLTTAVLEGLNILEVVTADRVVAQISADYPEDGGLPRISLAGSHFENLRLAGFEALPASMPTPTLLQPKHGADASQSQLTLPIFQETGREQADRLVGAARDEGREAFQWIVKRFEWMTSQRTPREDGCVLCSLIDGVDSRVPGRAFGHVIEIPDFGRSSSESCW